jgi:PIN domain nuclease of toxin-antitoxin system
MTTTERYLLDTCMIIYLAHDEPISQEARQVLDKMPAHSRLVQMSAFSAWEVGMLASRGRLKLTRPPLDWFRVMQQRFGIDVVPLVPEILVASSFLPEPVHGDPADRILIATAREHDLTIITRDRAILAYGAAGHVKTLAC